MEKIFEVTELNISLLENFPPQMQITASGTVRTGGWSNPKLMPHIHIHAPPDGIYGFDFVADPPKGVAAQVISPIEVADLWGDLPEGVKGVRVHASQNSKIALLTRAGQPDRRPNRFIFSDNSTRIEFFPKILAPSGEGQPSADAGLEYHGSEGQFVFKGGDITYERTVLGSLISVILRPDADSGRLDFALVLPPINLGGKARQEFQTMGIKIHSKGRTIHPQGPELTYEVIHFKGVAEDIPIL